MHILIVVLHRPTKPTGVCRHAANLALCLAETDRVSQVTLVTGQWQRDYFETVFLLTSDKIKIIDIDIKNSSTSRNLWFLWNLPSLVKSLQPDLVHLSFPLPFLRSRFPCPVVTTIHDLYAFDYPENFGQTRAFFNRSFFRQCVRQSDGLACVSQNTQKRLLEYFPECGWQRNIAAIYNYVNFNRISPSVPEIFSNGASPPFFLCVAQHRKNKNLNILINAFSKLKSTRTLPESTLLIIVGSSGPETELLHRLVDTQSLEESVFFLSALEDAQLSWLYQHCKLFIMPSSLEGFCIPLVEALYFSCRIVCSDIPIFKEFGSSNCIYFDINQNATDNLAQGILEALNCTIMTIMIEEGTLSRFSKAEVTKQYMDFYSKVLRSKLQA
jgi:glycosyltransferase involved in cell wall biosynthesis